ncbi:MAG: TetR/AcrR family transcriptional regulator [Steroidobacterales bacterium]
MSAESRRELILEQAKKLFATRGYSATSIDDIAAASGVTKPVVYDHFASKRELYVGLMRTLRDALRHQAAADLRDAHSPREAFQHAIESFYTIVKRDPAIVQLLFVQSRNQPELLREWERLQAEAIAQIKPLARALAPRLEPWQIGVFVQFLHHGLNSTVEVWPKNVSVKQMADLVVTILWSGLESVA